jgi:fumarylacetoacetase
VSGTTDATHDPARDSWVASANATDADFPLQNLPYGRFRRLGSADPWRVGVAIGDAILDPAGAILQPVWPADVRPALTLLAAGDLNAFMAYPVERQRDLRVALSDALAAGSPAAARLDGCLVVQADAEMAVPCRIGDFTDFYTGIHHATAVGRLFRPDNPLLPNYKWLPIGYHGRASSIGVSGQRFPRPRGQTKGDGPQPTFGPARRVDIEVELGIFVGAGNAPGHPMSMAEAERGWFGLVLLNDWSARDIQAWEYQPLGPFLAKSFATTISPWIVTRDALAPFRVPFGRPAGDPDPLPYLDSPDNRRSGGVDVTLEAWILTRSMRERGLPAQRLMRSRYADAYWTVAQLLAHHSSNGCNLAPGDLLGSGTQSGPGEGEGGSLLELSNGGRQPISLASGETRTFLEDGDTVTLKAWCERPRAKRIGLGVCEGTVLPALG